MMKKLLSLVLGLLMLPLLTEASSSSQVITLSPWWNVMSTPAVLSSLEFSNGWEWISFSTLKEWSWVSVPATTNNIKPLDGFLVYNSNNNDVSLTLNFKENSSPSDKIFQKNLELWWNLVWITTTQDPLKTISPVMEIDVTDHLTNKVNSDYSNTINPELWEAYFVFIDKKDTIYGWVVEQVVQTEQTGETEEDAEEGQIVKPELKIASSQSAEQTVSNTNLISIVKFRVKVSDWTSTISWFTLKWLSNDNPNQKNKLNIYVWDLPLIHEEYDINNSWDIIVHWLHEELSKNWKTIEVWLWDPEWWSSYEYKLTNVNWVDADINFKTNFISND